MFAPQPHDYNCADGSSLRMDLWYYQPHRCILPMATLLWHRTCCQSTRVASTHLMNESIVLLSCAYFAVKWFAVDRMRQKTTTPFVGCMPTSHILQRYTAPSVVARNQCIVCYPIQGIAVVVRTAGYLDAMITALLCSVR